MWKLRRIHSHFFFFTLFFHFDFRLELLTECEAHPDKWFRGWARTKYEINLARAATFLGSDVKNLVFVTNPTTAINAIFNSMTFKAEDTILCYSHTYNAVKNIAEQTAQKWGCQVHYLELKLPIQSEDEIVDVSSSNFERTLFESYSKCRIWIFAFWYFPSIFVLLKNWPVW